MGADGELINGGAIMEKLKLINLVKTSDKVTVSLPVPEYEMVRKIADENNMSIVQVLGQIVRHGLKDGYEVEEIRI